jgi:hypothetical protein
MRKLSTTDESDPRNVPGHAHHVSDLETLGRATTATRGITFAMS